MSGLNLINGHSTINGHSNTLNGHSAALNGHSNTLNGQSHTLNRHSNSLNGHSNSLNGHSNSLNGHGTSLNGHNTINGHSTVSPGFIQPYVTDDGFFMAPSINLEGSGNECLLFPWEQSVTQALASVMLYNGDTKRWEHAGGTQVHALLFMSIANFLRGSFAD